MAGKNRHFVAALALLWGAIMKMPVALTLATLLFAGCGGGGSIGPTADEEPTPAANEAPEAGPFSPAADPKPSTETATVDTGAEPSTEPTPADTGAAESESAPVAESGASEAPDTSVVAADTSTTPTPDTSVAADSATPDTKVAAADTSTPSAPDTAVADTGPVTSTWRKANLTTFTSYPDPGSEECIAYSGCTWAGQFAALDGKQPESWVKANNIAAVHSKDFGTYELKTLRLRQGTKEIDVKVYDMCADTDCSGCCTANAKSTGFLIDLEKYTTERFGTSSGTVEWTCLDC